VNLSPGVLPLLLLLAATPSPAGAAVTRSHAATAKKTTAVDAPFWTGHPDTTAFKRINMARLTRAHEAIERLSAVHGPRTIANTLQPYDDALLQLDAVSAQSSLMENVHPDSALRATAEDLSQKASAFATELSLNRKVYEAIQALDVGKADAETRYYVVRTLRDFRLSGVDKDDATREQIRRINDELVLVSQEFNRNIRSDVRSVQVKSAAELEGLPADYIARHKPDANGIITLTIDYPDATPVFSYAKNDDLRHRMYMEYNNRAYPQNMAVLDSLIWKRDRLAHLAGFSNWADYVTADKMVGSGKNASDFIDKIVAASTERAQADYQQLLARKKKDVPDATGLTAWETGYYSELVRRTDYDFDAQALRPYFPYSKVKQGVLDVTAKMFNVTFRPVKNAPVWDPSVDCYEMFEGGKLVGRFYLDMHPRKDKYNHAAQFDVRTGVAGRQIPEAALICNFPGGDPKDPGLMEYSDARTFFHEFGHLLHTMFAGHHHWVGIGGIRTEQDFVEAPSQMLEEWMENPAVLATFARQYQTNEPIPAALVNQMVRANEFGKGMGVRRQMVYAQTSLSIYDRDPTTMNTDRIIQDVTKKYQTIPYVPDTHFQTAFGHLDGYSAVYYTYMWSLVIAKDMFSKFNANDLLDPTIATRYRDAVLAPGGTAPAAKLVENFLGRPFSFEAYRAWLNRAN
jgi:thimet oligopeptidase